MVSSPEIAGKTVLVTGATGSFGTAFLRRLLDDHEPATDEAVNPINLYGATKLCAVYPSFPF